MDDNIGAGRTMDKYFFQPAGRWVEQAFMTVALLLHANRGGGVRVSPVVPVPVLDSASVSDTSTVTNNPGPGRIIDMYIYQTVGRMLERCAGRIAMSTYLSASEIWARIEEVWYNVEIKEPCFVCRYAHGKDMSVEEKVRMAVSRVEGAPSGTFILAGVKEITKRLR